MNLGDTGDTTAIVLGATTQLSDAMSLGAKLGYVMSSPYFDADKKVNGGDGDVTITEIDVNFGYALGEQTKYSAVFAYVTVDDDSAVDKDAATSMMHQITLSFE